MRMRIANILLSIITIQMGVSIFILIQLISVKISIQETFKKSKSEHFVHLIIPSDEFNGASEFEYQGNLYDAVSFEQKGDLTYVVAINDKEEKQLKQAIAQNEYDGNTVFQKNTSSFFFYYNSSVDFEFIKIESSIAKFSTITCKVSKGFKKEGHAPPREA